jgi:HAE1 family hydrophobic/amphiphilic exporter-1
MMTTTTTVLGLAPLVLFPGAGSELYRGLGGVVLGGLMFSTIFTLWLIPSLFKLIMGSAERLSSSVRPAEMSDERDTQHPRPARTAV